MDSITIFCIIMYFFIGALGMLLLLLSKKVGRLEVTVDLLAHDYIEGALAEDNADKEKEQKQWILKGKFPNATHTCPKCKSTYEDYEFNYCPSCGVRLDLPKE